MSFRRRLSAQDRVHGDGGSEDKLQCVLVSCLRSYANLFSQVKRKQEKVQEVKRLSVTHCGTTSVHTNPNQTSSTLPNQHSFVCHSTSLILIPLKS